MISRGQKIRAGVFFFVTTVLLVAFVFFIVGKTLFKERDFYNITYKNVSVNGLQLGSSVKYYGINIGRVEDITFNKDDVNDVIIEISVDAGTPIKEDVEATLVGVGITGLKQIEIIGGSNDALILNPGDEIKSGKSAISDITGKAEIIASKSELLINRLNDLLNDENRNKVALILNSADKFLNESQGIIIENRPKFERILANVDTIGINMKLLTENSNIVMEDVRNILESGEIQTILTNTEAISDSINSMQFKSIVNEDFVESLTNFNLALKQFNETITHIDLTVLKGREDFLNILEEMEESAEYLKEFSRQINEDPSSLIRQRK